MSRTSKIPRSAAQSGRNFYDAIALISDPIHGYISFVAPMNGREVTEKTLIDTPWMQRLRCIMQLQGARWVFPSAEHSRFQHSLGAMHLAGRFAQHLYPSLKESFPNSPSLPYIESLLRVTALLHDVGHGPFGHFFDENVLDRYGLTHERVGQKIIVDELGDLIRKIRMAPSGPFERGEALDPAYVAYLILKDPRKDSSRIPRWLAALQPIIGGIYTADNMDYILRDSYMCGVSVGPVDVERLLHYSFITRHGLTMHRAGLSALQMFLNTRQYLYTNIYYHRTTRAIDLHLKEIFKETMGFVYPKNPMTHLRDYLSLSDWSLLEEVRRWPRSRSAKKRRLGLEWERILSRNVKWKMAFDVTLPTRGEERGRPYIAPEMLTERIRAALPSKLRRLPFAVDMAYQDPRPVNPLSMGEFQIYVYNPSTRQVSKEMLRDTFDFIPAKIVQYRVFTLDHGHDGQLSAIVERILADEGPEIKTHV